MAGSKPNQTVLISAVLGGLTVLTYWPVFYCEFVNFDDPSYVTQNPHVLGGLTLPNALWAFKTAYFGNWHPVTWLSHMLDVAMFGLNPGYHHLTNLFLHLCNTLLLFLVLKLATQRIWASATVAALFAVHPLHVESVAWISERKDVLSTFSGLLSLLSYLKFVDLGSGSNSEGNSNLKMRSNLRYYVLAFVFFALGLMSKAMIVTLPFVMLLLDYWPLGRLNNPGCRHAQTEQSMNQKFDVRDFLALVREKLPFFILAFLFTVISSQALAQSSAIRSQASPANTVANVCVSYLRYIGKTFWPIKLAAFYPRAEALPLWQVAASAATLIALSALAILLLRRRPYVGAGWFWFLGTLVPVIGLPFGDHAMADRYTYVPLIGLFIVVVWGIADLKSHTEGLSPAEGNLVLAATGVVLIGACAIVSRHQLKYWRNSEALLEHILAVSGDSAMVHNNLGVLLMVKRDWTAAEKHFVEALRLEPTFPAPKANLATVLAHEGKAKEATEQLNGLNPAWQIEGHRLLADVFLEQMMTNEAIEQYSAAIQLSPTNAPIRESLGLLLAEQGKIAPATEQFEALVKLRPDASSHYHLALSLLMQGKTEEAINHYQESIRLKPDWPEPLNDLAWLLATGTRADLRNGPKAVELAERACKLTQYKEARFLGTLDAAYAEAGRFAEAITTADQARNLALATGDKTIADLAGERLKLYKAGLPFHQQ